MLLSRSPAHLRVTGVPNSFVIVAQPFACGSCLASVSDDHSLYMGFWSLLSAFMDFWPSVQFWIIANYHAQETLLVLCAPTPFLPTSTRELPSFLGNPPSSHPAHVVLWILTQDSNLLSWLEQLGPRWAMWVQESQAQGFYWNLARETFSLFLMCTFNCQRPRKLKKDLLRVKLV